MASDPRPDDPPDLGDHFVLPLTLVPRPRLGELLRRHREALGRSRRDIVTAGRGTLRRRDVRRLERGGTLPPSGLDGVVAAYGIDPGVLVPPRTVVEVGHGRRWIGADRLDEPWVLEDGDGEDPTEGIVLRYLALVYALRGREVGTHLTLRIGDLAVLARDLHRDPEDLARLAARLADDRAAELRRLTTEARRRLDQG